MISGEYFWFIPMYEEGVSIDLAYNPDTQKWELSSVDAELKSIKENSQAGPLDFSYKGAAEILKEQLGKTEAQDIKFVFCPLQRTNFLFISADNEEYLIPYSLDAKSSKLENGKVYEAADALGLLDKNTDTGYSGGDVEGAAGFRGNAPAAAFAVTAAALVVTGLAVLIIIKIKRVKK